MFGIKKEIDCSLTNEQINDVFNLLYNPEVMQTGETKEMGAIIRQIKDGIIESSADYFGEDKRGFYTDKINGYLFHPIMKMSSNERYFPGRQSLTVSESLWDLKNRQRMEELIEKINARYREIVGKNRPLIEKGFPIDNSSVDKLFTRQDMDDTECVYRLDVENKLFSYYDNLVTRKIMSEDLGITEEQLISALSGEEVDLPRETLDKIQQIKDMEFSVPNYKYTDNENVRVFVDSIETGVLKDYKVKKYMQEQNEERYGVVNDPLVKFSAENSGMSYRDCEEFRGAECVDSEDGRAKIVRVGGKPHDITMIKASLDASTKGFKSKFGNELGDVITTYLATQIDSMNRENGKEPIVSRDGFLPSSSKLLPLLNPFLSRYESVLKESLSADEPAEYLSNVMGAENFNQLSYLTDMLSKVVVFMNKGFDASSIENDELRKSFEDIQYSENNDNMLESLRDIYYKFKGDKEFEDINQTVFMDYLECFERFDKLMASLPAPNRVSSQMGE